MKKLLFSAIALAALVSLSTFAREEKSLTPQQKLMYAEAIIENYYVDSINSDSLVTEAIVSMLKTLDPHSQYSSPEETKELNQPLEGKFSGIGIQFSIVKDTVCVIQTTGGGPSERVGIRPGDRIVYVNDSLFTHPKMVNSEVLKTLRGEKGTEVKLRVKRGASPELIEFRIIRDDIPIYSVDASYMVAPEVGFISITRFAESTPKELDRAIEKLAAQGMKHLILDLQSNGGGYLGAAHGVASRFLDEGDMVVFTKGLNTPPQYFTVERNDFGSLFKDKFNVNVKDKPKVERLVIMVDQYSASASEIVSGAIQDNDRGLIVGRRTFGKGLVQRPFPFPDGSMIRLTTSRYYTPSGRLIQKHYDKGQTEEYQLDMLNRYNNGELFSADSIHFDPALKTLTLKNQRTVYGGGGIMPDIFVPLDTTMYSNYYRDLSAKNTFNNFIVNTLDKQRRTFLDKYPTEDDFYRDFKVSPEMLDRLTQMARKDSIKIDEKQIAASQPIIEATIRGLLARDLYKDGTYVRAVNPLNPIFNQALKVITDPLEYDRLLGNSHSVGVLDTDDDEDDAK